MPSLTLITTSREPEGESVEQLSDGSLMVAIGQGRPRALDEAYRRHAGSMFAMANRVSRRREIAEDVVQEVFLRLWNNPTRFDPSRGSLRTYLMTEAHNRAIDAVRSDSSRTRREERDGLLRETSRGHDPELETLDGAVAESVQEAMASLPPGEREAIELAYFGGYTYRQVAEKLGQPEGTVKSRIRAGLRRMRSDMRGQVVAWIDG